MSDGTRGWTERREIMSDTVLITIIVCTTLVILSLIGWLRDR